MRYWKTQNNHLNYESNLKTQTIKEKNDGLFNVCTKIEKFFVDSDNEYQVLVKNERGKIDTLRKEMIEFDFWILKVMRKINEIRPIFELPFLFIDYDKNYELKCLISYGGLIKFLWSFSLLSFMLFELLT